MYSDREILVWVNKSLDVNIKQLEDLCSGAEYCKLLHKLCPWAINLKKVLLTTKTQAGFIHNMKLLQKGLKNQGVEKQIPIHRMVDGAYRENLEFAQWFKTFYEHNHMVRKDEIAQENGKSAIGLVKPHNISLTIQPTQDAKAILGIMFKNNN
ncbi:microtubule-associated protein RP/EB family member 1 [Drosophila elegans]|uniref:microtubule-associated protein RP/EB family member 1 n=1 Tax=Drosophila elegans TaxID=30023 RepID=UPI0007E76356|nr:microtubule-associated protein RP/EB family member 1 [Drosophila elegans]